MLLSIAARCTRHCAKRYQHRAVSNLPKQQLNETVNKVVAYHDQIFGVSDVNQAKVWVKKSPIADARSRFRQTSTQ